MLAAALRLALLGFSVVPVDRYKRPLGLWKEFQTRRAEAREIEDWYRFAPDAGIGIVTGAISDLVVADIEFHSPWFVEDHDVPMCVSSETQRGGRHFFFTHDPAVRTGPLFDLGMRVGDIKSEGGLVVVPPSEGRAGSYRWLAPPWERPLAEGWNWVHVRFRNAAGVWSDPALSGELPKTRFAVTCKLNVAGKMPRADVRWHEGEGWNSVNDWYTGDVSACKLSSIQK